MNCHLRIFERPTEFEHQRVPMRTDDPLPAIALDPRSTVTVIRNRTCPEMAITLTRAPNNEPLKPLPLPIARGRQGQSITPIFRSTKTLHARKR